MDYGGSTVVKNLIQYDGLRNQDAGAKYQYDASFNGVDEERKCTDVGCLVLFLVYLSGMLGLLIFAYTKSFVSYLYLPTDYRGQICGYDNTKLNVANAAKLNNLTGLDYLFWWRPGPKSTVRSSCVASCPDLGYFIESYALSSLGVYFNFNTSVGVYTVNGTNKNVYANVEDYSNPNASRYVYPYASQPLLFRCLPTTNSIGNMTAAELREKLGDVVASIGTASAVVSDFKNTWWLILAAAVIALFVSIVWIMALHSFATIFVWSTVILSICACAFLSYESYIQSTSSTAAAEEITNYTFGILTVEDNRKAFHVLFIVLCVISSIIILMTIFLAKRINLSISIIKAVSRTFSDVKSLFVFPVFQYSIMIVWWLYCLFVAAILYGTGTFSSSTSSSGIISLSYTYDNTIRGLCWFHFFGFVWGTAFIFALGEVTISGVFTQHFFSREKKLDGCPIMSSLWRALRYHSGTIAFGSLNIALLTVVRVGMEVFDKKTRESQNTFVKFLVKCMKCCLWCFERFVKFVNKNAYVMVAAHGESFYTGAKNSFNLILRNAIRAGVVDWVSSYTFLLGRLLVSAGVTGACILVMAKMGNIAYEIIPAVIIAIFTFLVGGSFTSLFEMGIDSSFLCCLEDEERNDGSPGRERFAPEGLKEAMKL